MEKPGDNVSSSVSSDYQLFTVNGAPLKFNLFGYSMRKSEEMIQIIETYGGKLSDPNDPDTFVFCEPNCPVKAGECNRYNFQYILDTMGALRPQELINYKLEASRPYLEKKEQDDDKSQISSNCRPQVATDQRAESPVDEKCFDLLSPSADKQSQLPDIQNSCKKEQRADVCSFKTEESTGVDHLNKNKSISIVSQSTEDPDSKRVGRKRRSFRTQRLKRGLKTGRHEKIIFTEDESLRMIKWFKENKLLPVCAGIGVWKRMLREKVLPNRNCSYYTVERYFKRNLQKIFESGGPIPQSQYLGKRTLGKLWTDREMRIVINYLIDNNAIPRAGNREVMRKCLKLNKSLLHPTRTIGSLVGLFYSRLRYEYRRLTDDPVALKKFKRFNRYQSN